MITKLLINPATISLVPREIIVPKKVAIPDFVASVVFRPPIISPITAPSSNPKIIPTGVKNIPKNIPITLPQMPCLVAPYFLANQIGIK